MKKVLLFILFSSLVYSQTYEIPLSNTQITEALQKSYYSNSVRVENYIGAYDTSLGWSLVIQAAIDANLGSGKNILFDGNKVYEIQRQKTDPYQASYATCIDLKTGGIGLIIPSTTTLKLKDGQMADDTSGINIIVFRNASNIYIGGGGTITGNTAGQTEWIGGYSQGDPAIIRGIGNPIGSITNNNIWYDNLRLVDHWGCAVNTTNAENIHLTNLSTYGVGEGFQVQISKDIFMSNLLVDDSTDTFVGDGIELSSCNNFIIENSIIRNNGAGTAFDIYGSSNGVIKGFLVDGWGSGGISVGNGVNAIPSDDVVFSDGVIKKTGGSAIYVGGAGAKTLTNIHIDSSSIGIQISDTLGGKTFINNCVVKNNSSSAVRISGNQKVYISGGSFVNNLRGFEAVRTFENHFPEIHINGAVFSDNSEGITISSQGDATWFPYGTIGWCSFYNNTTDLQSTSGSIRDIYAGNLTLPSIQIVNNNMNVLGYSNAFIKTSFTFNSLTAGFRNQILSVDALFNTGSGIVVADYRAGTGNIQLDGGQSLRLEGGDRLTLKYNADSLRWVQTAFSPNSTYGITPLVVGGWSYNDVDANLTTVNVARYSDTTSMGSRYYLTRNAYLRKLTVVSNEARTEGTLTAYLYRNGSEYRNITLNADTTTINTATYTRGSVASSAGSYFEVKLSTSVDWTPTTADIQVYIELEY